MAFWYLHLSSYFEISLFSLDRIRWFWVPQTVLIRQQNSANDNMDGSLKSWLYFPHFNVLQGPFSLSSEPATFSPTLNNQWRIHWAVTFRYETSSRWWAWNSHISQSSLWMCQKQPAESVEGCDTARQTQDNHIEGEDSTTGLESESRTTEQFKLLPCGKCLSHQIPRKRNWTGLRTTLMVITPFPLSPSRGRISSPKVCTCLEKSCQPKRDSYRERKWPFSALGFFSLSMLRWHIYSAMDTCQLTGKHLDPSDLTV